MYTVGSILQARAINMVATYSTVVDIEPFGKEDWAVNESVQGVR